MQCMHIHAGVIGLELTSSVESVGGYVTGCPHTTLTFTCSATQVSSLTWLALPYLNEDDTVIIFASETAHSRIVGGVFNVSLVSVENMMGHSADLMSTLSAQANDISNGTHISCLIFSDSRSITILKEGAQLLLFKIHYYCHFCLQLPFHL